MLSVAHKGMLSFEAAAALAVLAFIMISLPHGQQYNAKVIFTVQKMDDLLIVWARGGESISEMSRDSELSFGENNFEIEYGSEVFGGIIGAKISREIIIFENGAGKTMRLSVKQ